MLVRLNTPPHRPKAASEIADLGNASKPLDTRTRALLRQFKDELERSLPPDHMIDFLSSVSERGQKYRNV